MCDTPKTGPKPETETQHGGAGGYSTTHYSKNTPNFITELQELLNSRSMESGSNTPDFILAHYLTDCLRAWNRATKWREDWYGRTPQEVPPPTTLPPHHHV